MRQFIQHRSAMLAAMAVTVGFGFSGSLLADSGVWNVDANGNWETATTAPWLNGIVADGADNTADFSQVDITANRTVTMTGPLTIGNLKFGDSTTAGNDWTLTGSTLTLQTSIGVPSINVVNRSVTISTALAGDQGFTKDGAGNLTFRLAANTYSGPTVINAGKITLDYGSTASTLGSGDITINSGAELAVSTNGNFNFTQAISGSGTLSIGNSASVVQLSNTNASFTGSIKTQDGVLELTDVAGSGLGNANVYSGYNMKIRSSDNNARTISNKVNFAGAGGSFNFGGAQGGTTNLGDMTFTYTGSIAGTNTSKFITVTNDTVVTFDAAFTSGGVSKNGTGTLVLNGISTTNANTAISGGVLAVNGSLDNSAVTINADGTLGGTGSVKTITVNADGTVAPGNSIGTLTAGTTVFHAGSLLDIELGAGVSDLLIVNGNLTLDSGAILNVLGTADNATDYIIASYTGTLSGDFGSPTLPDGYHLDYHYDNGVNTNNIALVYTAVPEPATMGLFGLGLGLIGLRRRRR